MLNSRQARQCFRVLDLAIAEEAARVRHSVGHTGLGVAGLLNHYAESQDATSSGASQEADFLDGICVPKRGPDGTKIRDG